MHIKSKNFVPAVQILVLLLMFFVAPTLAHHSVGGTYDETSYQEIGGFLKDVKWRNPHVQLEVLVSDVAGQETTWMVEMASISLLRRHGLQAGFMKAGERIKVYGMIAWKNPHRMLGRNLLLQNNREVILQASGSAHWPEESESSVKDLNAGRIGEGSAPELGIFRVWSLPTTHGGGSFWNKEYPLTSSAKEAIANYDSKSEKLMVNCNAKGLPAVMAQPYPIQFVKDGNDIVLKLEEFDTLRPIKMSAGDAAKAGESIVGYSSGRWLGKTLLVTTTDIAWSSFDGRGIPFGPQAALVERFTPTEDGSRLDYTMTVLDPTTFAEPVVLEKFWFWYPDVSLMPYNCEY